MDPDDETSVTEITLAADGRIFVFGLSREVLAVLREFCPLDHPLLAIPTEPVIAGDVRE
jgi:hypothetical protein